MTKGVWRPYLGIGLGCLVGGFLCTCKPSEQTDKDNIWLATVDDQHLYLNDFKQQLQYNPSLQNNTREIKSWTKDWIIQQLTMKKAQDIPNINTQDMERKVMNYRYALILYELEKQYIQQHMKKTSLEDLKKHYLKRKEDYMLQFPILRMAYLRVPLKTPKLSPYRQALVRYRTADKQRLIADCAQEAHLVCHMEDTLWRSIPQAVEKIPSHLHPKLYEQLGKKTLLEAQDEQFAYLLRILDYVPKGNTAPFAYVQNDIAQHMAIQQKKGLWKK